MTAVSGETKAERHHAWRELATGQGEIYEAYGRALKEYGQGQLPVEALVRDVVDLTARGAADAVKVSVRLAEDYYRWAWSVIGIRVAGDGPKAEEQEPATADTEQEAIVAAKANTPGTPASSSRTPRQKG